MLLSIRRLIMTARLASSVAARAYSVSMQDNGANARRRIADQFHREASSVVAASNLQVLNTHTTCRRIIANRGKKFFSSARDALHQPCNVAHTCNTSYSTNHIHRLPNFGTPELHDKAPTRDSAFLYVPPPTYIYIYIYIRCTIIS